MAGREEMGQAQEGAQLLCPLLPVGRGCAFVPSLAGWANSHIGFQQLPRREGCSLPGGGSEEGALVSLPIGVKMATVWGGHLRDQGCAIGEGQDGEVGEHPWLCCGGAGYLMPAYWGEYGRGSIDEPAGAVAFVCQSIGMNAVYSHLKGWGLR